MSLQALLASLEPEIEDPEEESFLLFSQSIPSQNLGFVDAKATSVNITIGGRDLTLHQSPTILSSTRDGGTTGAGDEPLQSDRWKLSAHAVIVLWKITPLFATWIASSDNLFFKRGVITSASSVLELGCGISGVIGMALSSLVQHYILTDQEYVMKLLNQNLIENTPSTLGSARKGRKSKPRPQKASTPSILSSNIRVQVMDWETDEVSSIVAGLDESRRSFDAIIACDCIYNDALIGPLVQTCVDACQLRRACFEEPEPKPTVCIIAQQLRSPEVFENWLKAFHKLFRVWRLPDGHLIKELAANSGFVIHVGVLR